MATAGLSRAETLGAVTLGIFSFPSNFDVFFPLVVHDETSGGMALLAFPLAASQGGMMRDMNGVVRVCYG
jgi:hypothetical protein